VRWLLAAVGIGVLLGLAQCLVLRLYVPQAVRWISLTAAAVLLAWIVGALAILFVLILASPILLLVGVLRPPDVAGFVVRQ
jgi:site-specific recombinase